MKRLLLLLFSFISISAFAQEYRDVVFLKNGSVIKGFYKELLMNDSLRMETIDGGVLVCSTKDIVRIAKEKTELYTVKIGHKEDRNWRPKGYVGTIEFGTTINMDNYTILRHSFITTHGYAFNRYVTLSGGIGLEQIQFDEAGYSVIISKYNMPIFADLKLNCMTTRIKPIVDLRAGYVLTGYTGLYFNPSMGVLYSFTPHIGAYFTVGYSYHNFTIKEEFDFEDDISLNFGFTF